jgi:hypothetical protein
LFLPALYVAWFRIKAPELATANNQERPIDKLEANLPAADAPSQRELENA